MYYGMLADLLDSSSVSVRFTGKAHLARNTAQEAPTRSPGADGVRVGEMEAHDAGFRRRVPVRSALATAPT
jgi:hypothetical protein